MNVAAPAPRTLAVAVAVGGGTCRLRVLEYAPAPGRRFVYLHGNPGAAEDCERLGPLLAGRGSFLSLDLPGFGDSDSIAMEPRSSALEVHARVVIAMLDALGFREPVTLIGHSHGAAVAQVFAGRFPDRVREIVLLGSLGHRAHPSYALLGFAWLAAIFRLLVWLLSRPRLSSAKRLFLGQVGRAAFSPDPPESAWMARLARHFDRKDAADVIARLTAQAPCREIVRSAGRVRCPVLMVHGAKDAVVPLSLARGLHAALVRAGARVELAVLEDAGHMLTHRNAAELARRIASWADAAAEPPG